MDIFGKIVIHFVCKQLCVFYLLISHIAILEKRGLAITLVVYNMATLDCEKKCNV